MKLETKLGLSTGGLIIAMFVSALSAHIRIQQASALSEQIVEQRMPLIEHLRDVRRSQTQSVGALESYILFGVDESRASAFRMQRAHDLEEAGQAMNAILSSEERFNSGEDHAKLAELQTDLGRIRVLEERVVELNETKAPDDVAQAYMLLQKDILALDEASSAICAEILDSERQQVESEGAQLKRANAFSVATLWIATLLGAVLCGTFSIVLGRRVSSGVNLVAERANAIAEGDLTGRALKVASDDQIGMLADAMNRMQAALGGVIGTVADTAGSLTGSAVSMRSASDQIHKRIDQQSQQTQQAATAMQEMSASIAEVSRHTQSAAETARSAAQTARDGGLIVKQMLGAMHSIANAVTETSSTVGLLGEDSKRISQIVTVIDEIARKTNLLALNAAIEAARAGDQGRGFAVVAGEVRRLAESTAQATGEIASMIQEIQDRTRSAIASMAAGTGTVEEGVVTTTQAGEALERIIGMAERVDRMITQIAIAASQQAAAADQSSASLDSIHSLSHENLSEMATTAAGIEGLRGTAVTLERQVDRFQVQTSHQHRAA